MKPYKINLTIPPPHVRSAPPFTRGRLNMRLSVDLILYVICCGQGQALSLRYNIKFNLITTHMGYLSYLSNLYGIEKRHSVRNALYR